jgi:diaminopimelate decarboxylase
MMPFRYHKGTLYAEEVALPDVAAQVGTPTYVYSRAALEDRWRAFDCAFGEHPHGVYYAVKANSNLAVLNVLARLGSGFDIVSGGELERVMRAGGDASKVVFSGVGKSAAEMRRALELGIACFNIESEEELTRLNRVAGELGNRAPVALRVNPDVDAGAHPYIATGLKHSKFGIAIELAPAVYERAALMPHIDVKGVDCHIGSQLKDLAPLIQASERILALAERLRARGLPLEHLDLGGGLGIRYRDESPPRPDEYVSALMSVLGPTGYKLLIEPGRAIAGDAGVLLTRVEYLKSTEDKNFAMVDAGMNDLIRPALYNAWQDIIPVEPRPEPPITCDVVGPVCETGDFLGKDRPLSVKAGDLLAVCSAGAYGFTMSSNYNSRPRAAEVMVDGAAFYLVRKRESIESLWAGEDVLP